ncbi:hypothetical protein B0H67DRAFT_648140 [Lasiosphaeris hirsuta]|uniref:Uncharacterized protein n=1 Tax=Lasiosphaeris hirsuta TaxID=260670 RepID=A0AA40A2I9_9PEZI|nr:hypothetical protein B0H67DRAFT_648140 [Lasiosphaeris hirsuta]
MPSFFLSIPLVGASFVASRPASFTVASSAASSVASSVAPSAVIHPSCMNDELLRLLKSNKPEAKPFCLDYLGDDAHYSTSYVTIGQPPVTVLAIEILTLTHT